MLILILIDAQTDSHRQNHSSSGFLHPVKKITASKISDSPPPPPPPPPSPHPPPLTPILKTLLPPPLYNNFYGIILLKTFSAAVIAPVHYSLYTKVMLILILINV